MTSSNFSQALKMDVAAESGKAEQLERWYMEDHRDDPSHRMHGLFTGLAKLNSLGFREYQLRAMTTAIYPDVGGHREIYPLLELAGEVGEVHEVCKKVLRDKHGKYSDEVKAKLKKELGDVLWALAALASEFNFSLEEIASENLEKLADRARRGKITGSGDER